MSKDDKGPLGKATQALRSLGDSFTRLGYSQGGFIEKADGLNDEQIKRILEEAPKTMRRNLETEVDEMALAAMAGKPKSAYEAFMFYNGEHPMFIPYGKGWMKVNAVLENIEHETINHYSSRGGLRAMDRQIMGETSIHLKVIGEVEIVEDLIVEKTIGLERFSNLELLDELAKRTDIQEEKDTAVVDDTFVLLRS